jgi:hypothetical protein
LRPQRSGRQAATDGPEQKIPLLTDGNLPRNGETVAGVDRISLSFPVDRVNEAAGWTTVGEKRGEGGRRQFFEWTGEPRPGFSVYVGALRPDPTRPDVWGKIECNPARLVDPTGCGLATVDDLRDAIDVAAGLAAGFVDPAVAIEQEGRTKRLDVARDFREIVRPDVYVQGLRNVKRPYAKRNAVYSDPSRGNAQTLLVGSGAGSVRLYNQHEAYAHRGAPEGAVRWECEARSDWLKKQGVSVIGDITTAVVDSLARERFAWSGCDLEVSGVDQVVERIRRSGLSPAKQQRLLGVLVLRASGHEAPMGKNQATEYDRLIRDLGVVLEPGTLYATAPIVARLDFDSGTEVVRAA